MPFVALEHTPEAAEFAANNPSGRLARLIVTGTFDSHVRYWKPRAERGNLQPVARVLLGLLSRDTDEVISLVERISSGDPAAMGERSQHAAQMLSVLALSTLLRTPEIGPNELRIKPDGEDGSRLSGLYLDTYVPDLMCLHAGPSVLSSFPRPLTEPGDSWYSSSTLLVHREQPPQPSSGALEHHPDLVNNPIFNGTFATLTPQLKSS